MKHLIKFNESKRAKYQIKNVDKIRKIYDELKYIIEDDGYDISFNDWKKSINIIIDSEVCKNGKWEIQEEYEEFLDRLKEALPEFKIDTYDIDENDCISKLITIQKKPISGYIKESKSERRNVVRQVVKDIVEIFKKDGEGDYILPEEISGEQEYEFDNLNTSFTLELEIVEDKKIKTFELEGGYFVEDEIMELCIIYNPSKFPEELYNLSGELNELIRHELQHLIQYERGDDQTEDNSSRENYYLSPHEIDAQVKGFKRISKLKGVPFEQVVKEWFDKNKKIHKLKGESVQRVIKRILNYESNKLNESFSFYNKNWENELPEMMSVIKDGKKYQFKKGNIMLNADMIQILYNNDVYGSPNTLEFDVYFSFNNNDNSIKLDIDITYGDLMVSEFSIEPPNKVNVVEYTSYNSKFNPGSVFALDNNSLSGLIRYLNKFGRGINLNLSDLKFLDRFDNYDPTKVLENSNGQNLKKYYAKFAEDVKELKYILEDEGFIVTYPLSDNYHDTTWLVIGNNDSSKIDNLSKNLDYKEFMARLKYECPFIKITYSHDSFDLDDTDRWGKFYNYYRLEIKKNAISKILENFNKSEFTFAEILQDLRDDFEIEFINYALVSKSHRPSLEEGIKETDATHDMFFDIIGDDVKRSPLRYKLSIKNTQNNFKSYEDMYDQIEEVVDRFADKNMYVYSVYFGMGLRNDRKYVALPSPNELWKSYTIGEIHPSYITIEFQSNKRNLEPTTKFGKFIDKFRNKTQTKYSEYTDDTGPG